MNVGVPFPRSSGKAAGFGDGGEARRAEEGIGGCVFVKVCFPFFFFRSVVKDIRAAIGAEADVFISVGNENQYQRAGT